MTVKGGCLHCFYYLSSCETIGATGREAGRSLSARLKHKEAGPSLPR